MPRLIAFTLVAGSKSPVVPSPFKSIPPTYALNGGALEYEKLSPSSNRQGNCVTPSRFRMWVVVLKAVVQIESVASVGSR